MREIQGGSSAWTDALVRLLPQSQGVLIFRGPRLEFASAAARRLLGPEIDAEDDGPALRETLDTLPLDASGIRMGILSFEEDRRVYVRVTSAVDPDDITLVLVEDLAARRSLESHLFQASRAATTTQVLRSQIHDIRAPLNAIVLNLDLLRSSIVDEEDPDHDDPETLVGYVDVAMTELERVNRSLGRLLTSAGPRAERWRRVDVQRLVRELVRLVRAQAASHNVRIVTLLGREPARVLGYRDRLKQVVLNVLNNAIEAMPGGGRLEVSLHERDHGFDLVFSDTGRGIAPELLERVFDLHVTSRPGGSGLGLFVVRSVIEAHGGHVDLQSSPGEGTTLTLHLPRATAAAAPASPDDSEE